MPLAPTRSLQGRYAVAQRFGSDNREDLARQYAEARLADYIQKVVEKAPPLSDAQRRRLALLLRGSDVA